MLQIKTIMIQNPELFDMAVNEALAEGWHIVRRLANREGFIAEMQKVVITEKERTCDNCKHCDLPSDADPCHACEDGKDGYPTGWEPIE